MSRCRDPTCCVQYVLHFWMNRFPKPYDIYPLDNATCEKKQLQRVAWCIRWNGFCVFGVNRVAKVVYDNLTAGGKKWDNSPFSGPTGDDNTMTRKKRTRRALSKTENKRLRSETSVLVRWTAFGIFDSTAPAQPTVATVPFLAKWKRRRDDDRIFVRSVYAADVFTSFPIRIIDRRRCFYVIDLHAKMISTNVSVYIERRFLCLSRISNSSSSSSSSHNMYIYVRSTSLVISSDRVVRLIAVTNVAKRIVRRQYSQPSMPPYRYHENEIDDFRTNNISGYRVWRDEWTFTRDR